MAEVIPHRDRTVNRAYQLTEEIHNEAEDLRRRSLVRKAIAIGPSLLGLAAGVAGTPFIGPIAAVTLCGGLIYDVIKSRADNAELKRDFESQTRGYSDDVKAAISPLTQMMEQIKPFTNVYGDIEGDNIKGELGRVWHNLAGSTTNMLKTAAVGLIKWPLLPAYALGTMSVNNYEDTLDIKYAARLAGENMYDAYASPEARAAYAEELAAKNAEEEAARTARAQKAADSLLDGKSPNDKPHHYAKPPTFSPN